MEYSSAACGAWQVTAYDRQVLPTPYVRKPVNESVWSSYIVIVTRTMLLTVCVKDLHSLDRD
jgi:hypothetical protein